MNDDPLKFFGEQQRSYELVEEHLASLLAKVAEVVTRDPEYDFAGLILEPDASEAPEVIGIFEAATGQRHAGGAYSGLVSRAMMLEIVRKNVPAMLEWVPASRSGDQRVLPILIGTKNGFRCAGIPYDVAS